LHIPLPESVKVPPGTGTEAGTPPRADALASRVMSGLAPTEVVTVAVAALDALLLEHGRTTRNGADASRHRRRRPSQRHPRTM